MQTSTLAEQHLGLVAGEARRMARRLGGRFHSDDLVGNGCMGLMAAARLFDATRGMAFPSFARMKIRAAMLDGMRDLDILPRRSRAALRSVEKARARYLSQNGREPSRAELAQATSLPEQTVEDLQAMEASTHHEPLDLALTLGSGQPDPHEALAARQVVGQLGQAVYLLPQRLQQVLVGYYLQEMTFREIGRELGVTESRVSQLHSEAIRALRTALC